MQTKKIHICHLVYSFDVGGLERIIVNCINHLNNEIFHHTIISLTDTGQFINELNDSISHYSLNKKSGNDFSIYKKLYSLLRDLQPDVLHSYNLGTIEYQWIGLLAKVPKRIHAEHGRDSYDPKGAVKKYQWLRRLCSLAIHKVVTVSEDLEQWLAHDVLIPRKKLALVVNGVDTEFFNTGFSESLLPSPYSDKLVFGHVARLHAIKNQCFFLKAFLVACQRSEDFAHNSILVVVGDGPDRDKLNQYVFDNEELMSRVVFVGSQTNVKQFYRWFDVFLMSSIAEGIPMTLLESMSMEVPHLVTRVGGINEVISEGETGLSVVADDLEGYVHSMLILYERSDYRTTLGRQARKRVVQKFSQKQMVASYSQLYSKD